jgi:hypothetical protein
MSKKVRQVIHVAAREKRRVVTQAVGANFLKTITEPFTNSDSALKKMAQVPHSAGLVDRVLQLNVGDRVDTSSLKLSIPKSPIRRIKLELTTVGRDSRMCRVIDAGPGMTASELSSKFGIYAEAKAKGERTRSLFGRGALDVLLYHEDSVIYSVSKGVLSRCQIFWEQDAMIEVEELGQTSVELLNTYDLPRTIMNSGTVVQFRFKEGTPIPQEDQIIAKISSFYMLRLIAADPNTEVVVDRVRSGGHYTDRISYDFPIGTVIGRFDDELDLGTDGKYKVEILLARSDQPLQSDPTSIERRENGLLFVDDTDSVMDLTLLPEFERNPYLQHMYGIVRVLGFRSLLEAKLEAEDAVAVLTETRDGFNRKNAITQALFSLVEKHVKPLYEKEEKRQRKGDTTRSEKLNQRIKNALKALNEFNSQETDENGVGTREREPELDEPIYFPVRSIRLYAGVPKRISAFVNIEKVKNGEVVLFESDNSEIVVEPNSDYVKHRKGKKYYPVEIQVSCSVKGQKGNITALTLGKDGEEYQALLQVVGVDDPPVFEPPAHIGFTASRYSGYPNRLNKAVLLVNLDSFTGLPEIAFWLEDNLGSVVLGDEGQKRIQIKVTKEDVMRDQHVARVAVIFRGTGWGQRAVLNAKAKQRDGSVVYAKCRLIFERPAGGDRFTNFHYEDLGRHVLGDVAGDKLYINAGYNLHKKIFGTTEDEFNKELESNPIAQIRAASVLVETIVHHAATVKHLAGGAKGLQIDPADPIGSFRTYFEEHRMGLEPSVFRALAPEIERRD